MPPLHLLSRDLRVFTHQRKSYLRVNYIKERVIFIIPITKDEAQRLNKDFGVKFGDYGISSTRTKHKKFFLTEDKRNISALNEIRGIKSQKNKPNFRNKRVGV